MIDFKKTYANYNTNITLSTVIDSYYPTAPDQPNLTQSTIIDSYYPTAPDIT